MTSRTMEPSGFAGYAPQNVDEGQESISVIDRYSNFDGTYHSTRDLRIEGQVKGTIECRGTLHIAQGANIDAKVEADNISVAGELQGEITCRGKLQLLPSGRVRGKINTVTLVIHEGAYYEGELEMAAPDNRLSGRTARSRSVLSSSAGPTPINQNDGEGSEAQPSAPAGAGNTFIRRFGGQEQQWDETRGQEPTDRSES
ncbi:MAG TPA: polymer-forming cytoskeletal protein [Thermomicrobiales bacterium]|nr:polymer-forming cytoskeletal protein [Thermomicrobiales bacterium]